MAERNQRFRLPPATQIFISGIGSVPYTAVRMNRRAIGTELNPDYWNDACTYLREAEAQKNVPTLFDVFENAEAA